MTEAALADQGDVVDDAEYYDVEAERYLLGTLIVTPQAFTEVAEIVRADDFFDPVHRRIFELVERSYHGGADTITMASITEALGGGPDLGKIVAALVGGAAREPLLDIAGSADHIQQLAERRLTSAEYLADYFLPVPSKFGGQRWEEIGDTAGSRIVYDWLVEDVIPLGEITLVFGDSGSGKSFGTFDMMVKVALGLPFAGKNVTQGLVVYVAAEAGKGFGKRKTAYAQYHKMQPDAPIPFYLCTKRPNFFVNDNDVGALIEEITQVIKSYRQKLVCIVLDTLSALAPGMNENASQDVSMVRARLVALQDHFKDCAVVLVHHKPKGGSTPRGHGSLTADFETTIEFEKLADRSTDTGLPVHRASSRKQREGKSGFHWEFTLPVFETGMNKWGNPETSCVAVPFEASRISNSGYAPNGEQKVFLQALFKALAEDPASPPSGVNLPRSVKAVVEQALVRKYVAAALFQADGDEEKHKQRLRTLISRASKALRDAGVIGTEKEPTPIVWYTGKPVKGMQTVREGQ